MSNLKEIEAQLLGTGDLRQRIVRNLGSSSVAMLALYDNGLKFVGSGSLVFVGGSHYILTAAHVWDALQSAPSLGITVSDNIDHKFPIPIPAIVSTTFHPPKLRLERMGPRSCATPYSSRAGWRHRGISSVRAHNGTAQAVER
jgi:hypothetical protein